MKSKTEGLELGANEVPETVGVALDTLATPEMAGSVIRPISKEQVGNAYVTLSTCLLSCEENDAQFLKLDSSLDPWLVTGFPGV